MSSPEDIMATGPVRLKGLKGISDEQREREKYDKQYYEWLTPVDRNAIRQRHILDLGETTTYSTGKNLGSSRYDRPMYNLEDLQDIDTLRSEEQSSLSKLGAGFVKMGTTAATTFLDSTLGMMIGLGQGLVNLGDDDPKTKFRDGLWNNEFNKAMSAFQEKMEQWVPNYYSETELNAPWYKNIGTANFWGDKFLKNMGFTIGAMASLAVPGFNMSWVPRATMGAAKGLGAGYTGLKAASKAGKFATYALRTAVSANGEANIEAINAVNDNYNLEMANLNSRKREAVDAAYRAYQEHGNRGTYLGELMEIDSEYEAAKKEIEDGLVNVGNSVYLANMAVLSLTNYLEFGNYLKGGYNLQKGMKNLKMLADGKETSSMREFAKAVAQGKGSLERATLTGAEKAGKVAFGTAGRALAEGFEEGAQRLSSDTEQMKEQARINKWASDTGDTFYGKSINPDISEELTDRFKAMHHAWNTSFGDASSTGWEEVFLGALTGGIGTFNVRRGRTGKVGMGWQGGIAESIRDIKDREQDAARYVEIFNKHIQDPKFREKYTHAITAMSLIDEMDQALNLGKVLDFKNKEMLKIVNDAFFFKGMGAMDFFKEFYEQMREGMSEEDVALLREETKTINGGISPFGSMTDKEIVEKLKAKADTTLEKIDKSLELYDHLNVEHYDDAYKAAEKVLKDDESFIGGAPAMTEVLLREVTSEAAVIWDMERRREKIQKEIASMDAGTRALRGTQMEEAALKELNEEIERRTKAYNEHIDNFEGLAKTIKRINDLAIRRTAVKNNTAYKEAFKQAKSLQEVADLYFAIDPGETISDEDFNSRQVVFEDAIEEAEGENKALLESFKPFIASLNALNEIIDGVVDEHIRFTDDQGSVTLEDITNLDNLRQSAKDALRVNLQSIIKEYVEDESSPYDKGSLSAAIRKTIKTFSDMAEASENPAEKASLENTVNVMGKIVDELDKLDVVYSAATREAKSKDEDDDASAEDDDEDDGGSGNDEDEDESEDEDEDEEEDESDPDTTVVNNRKDAHKYANRRLRKALESDEDLQRFLSIIDSDDPSQEDRDWFNDKIRGKRKSFQTFVDRYMRVSPFSDSSEEDTGSGVSKEVDLKAREKALDEVSDTSVRVNPYRPYLQGSGMNDEEESDGSEEEKSDEEKKKEIEDAKKRPGIINGIGVLAIVNARNPKYYENWYRDEHFAPIASGIDYIVNNMLWKLLGSSVISPEGKLKVLYAEYYPKDGSRQMVFKGFKRRHILLVTPYTSSIESVIQKSNAAKILEHNIIESIGKDGKAHKYLVVGAYGFSSRNKTLAAGHELIDKAIGAQRTASTASNEWEVLEEGENGEYVNYIYDVSPGYVLRQGNEEDVGDRSLKYLLEHANPSGQTAKDVRISFWRGDPETTGGVHREFITRKDGDVMYEEELGHEPGEVVVWVPTSDGRFFPQHVSPIAFKELNESNGRVYADIMALIHRIAENPTDKKTVVKAVAALRGTKEVPGMLVFSPKHEGGTNMKYFDQEGVIVFEKNGVELRDESLYLERGDKTPEQIVEHLVRMLGEGTHGEGLNVLVALHASKLRKEPEYYIDSNVMMVNLRQWGTVNARAYAYPVRADGTIDPAYAPHPSRSSGRTLGDPFKMSVWLNGYKYVYDTATGEVRDRDNQVVTDRETLDQIADIRHIKDSGMKPVVDEGVKYFVLGNDTIYHLVRGNTYQKVTGNRLESVKKKLEVKKAIAEQMEVTHTKEEITKAIEHLQKKLANIHATKKEVEGFEPQTLGELVSAALASYVPGEYNPAGFLSEGLDPRIIEALSKGKLRLFSREGKKTFASLVDDIYQEALNAGFINDDDQNEVRQAVYDAIDLPILRTNLSMKSRMLDDIKRAIIERKTMEIRHAISMLEEELYALEQQEIRPEKVPQEPPEDMPDFDAPNKKKVGISYITHSSNGKEFERSQTVSIENRDGVIHISFQHSIVVRPEDVGLTPRDFAGNSEEYSAITNYEEAVKDIAEGGFSITKVFIRNDQTIYIQGLDGEVPIEGEAAETIFKQLILPMLNGQKVTLTGKAKSDDSFEVLTEDELKRKTEEEQLQRQAEITKFSELFKSICLPALENGDTELLDTIAKALQKIGAEGFNADAIGKIYDSESTRADMLNANSEESFIALLKKIAECGI